MNKYIIWLIDDIEKESTTYSNGLKLDMPQGFQIETICPPYRRIENYSALLENPDTACIIIDQKLTETGYATYTGIELAQYLRSINQKVPIYILTSYADEKNEFTDGEWSVEIIIPKDSFNARTVIARILRHTNVYEDILDGRAKRFNELLKKTLDDSLDEAELEELAELQFERTAPTLAKEVEELQELKQIAKTNEKLINLLSQDGEEESTDAG
jgi:CheY-like chemotaxis protein